MQKLMNEFQATLLIAGVLALTGYRLFLGQDVQFLEGVVTGAFLTIVNYKWGSSSGSARKTELMANGSANGDKAGG